MRLFTFPCLRLALLGALLFSALSAVLAVQTLPTTLLVGDDTFAANYEPGRVFADSPLLVALAPSDQIQYETFLRFDLSNINGQVTSAVLHLNDRVPGVDQLFQLDDTITWHAQSLSWANRPTGGNLLGTLTASVAGDVAIDITSAVNFELAHAKNLSLVLRASVGGGCVFSSHRCGDSYAANLVLQ